MAKKQKTEVENELEKVEILTRLFHGLSLDKLREVEKYLLPRGKVCETVNGE